METRVDYVEGTTKSGFRYKIEKDALDDWELVEQISEMDGLTGSVAVMKSLLGKEQYEQLKEHCRGPHGRVRATRMEEEMTEILNDRRPVKK